MANLKLDLVNKLNNDKFYDELEFVRLAQEPNMDYKTKITLMSKKLEKIALTNSKLGLIEQYFQEPAPQTTPQTAPAPEAPKGKVHQGQSHGE
jgi:hypothetical protein